MAANKLCDRPAATTLISSPSFHCVHPAPTSPWVLVSRLLSERRENHVVRSEPIDPSTQTAWVDHVDWLNTPWAKRLLLGRQFGDRSLWEDATLLVIYRQKKWHKNHTTYYEQTYVMHKHTYIYIYIYIYMYIYLTYIYIYT